MSASEEPPWATIDKVYNFGVLYCRVELLPAVASVPPGTEPDWLCWVGPVPVAVTAVTLWLGTPNLILIKHAFGGLVATRLAYTYNPANPILDVGGKPLPTFDHPVPWP